MTVPKSPLPAVSRDETGAVMTDPQCPIHGALQYAVAFTNCTCPTSPVVPVDGEIERLVDRLISESYSDGFAMLPSEPMRPETKAARSSLLKAINDLKREAVLAFYNGASVTTRRYLNGAEADKAVEELNAVCETALFRLRSNDR